MTPRYVMETVSPSAIKLYELCPRRWYYEYVLGFRSPPTEATEKGNAAHKELEDYYLLGIEPTTPKLREAIANERMPRYMPERERKYMIEVWLSVSLPSGIKTRMRADLIDLSDPLCPVILDHKTSSSGDYFLNEYQLRGDPQMIAYARAVVELFAPKAERVILAQNQISWGPERPRYIDTAIGVDIVMAHWAKLEQEIVADMLRDSKAASPIDVDAKLNACEAFRKPCPHMERCQSALFATVETQELVPMPIVTKTTPVPASLTEDLPLEVSTPKPKAKSEVIAEAAIAIEGEPTVAFPIRTLYVDCLPMNEEVETLSDVLLAPMTELAKKTGVPDWRLHEYGKGKGYVAAALKKMAAEGRLPKTIYVNTREDTASVALEVLAPLSNVQIYGQR